METLTVDVGHARYPISIGPGLLVRRELFEAALPAQAVMIVSNTTVAPLYAAKLRSGLAGRRVVDCVLPDGEEFKTLDTLATVFDVLVGEKLNRDAAVIALGGGVVGDIAGFAAACYQRGVGYVQVPTTLLAQVDSSVGGKTGVNHPGGKNLIGAFYQPLAVIADTDTLASLPDRELGAGLAEVIKYGCIYDAGLFAWLERACAAHAGAAIPRRPDRGDRALVRDQGGGRRPGRARARRARDTEFRPYLRPRDRGRPPPTGGTCTAKRSAWGCSSPRISRSRIGLIESAVVDRLRALLESARSAGRGTARSARSERHGFDAHGQEGAGRHGSPGAARTARARRS